MLQSFGIFLRLLVAERALEGIDCVGGLALVLSRVLRSRGLRLTAMDDFSSWADACPKTRRKPGRPKIEQTRTG